jgi:hypothetical protein
MKREKKHQVATPDVTDDIYGCPAIQLMTNLYACIRAHENLIKLYSHPRFFFWIGGKYRQAVIYPVSKNTGNTGKYRPKFPN